MKEHIQPSRARLLTGEVPDLSLTTAQTLNRRGLKGRGKFIAERSRAVGAGRRLWDILREEILQTGGDLFLRTPENITTGQVGDMRSFVDHPRIHVHERTESGSWLITTSPA